MDSWPEGQPYGVRETYIFTQQVRDLIPDPRVWDDIKATIDLDLARNPYIGQPIRSILRGMLLETDPSLLLLYAVDEEDHLILLVELQIA